MVKNSKNYFEGLNMARKFGVGDTVEVVKDLGDGDTPFDDDFKIGHRGTITRYDKGDKFSYEVTRKNGNNSCFKPQELKLIKRKIKNKGN